jgi:hypothetical protein
MADGTFRCRIIHKEGNAVPTCVFRFAFFNRSTGIFSLHPAKTRSHNKKKITPSLGSKFRSISICFASASVSAYICTHFESEIIQISKNTALTSRPPLTKRAHQGHIRRSQRIDTKINPLSQGWQEYSRC